MVPMDYKVHTGDYDVTRIFLFYQYDEEVASLNRKLQMTEEKLESTEERLEQANEKFEETSHAADESERSVNFL